MEYCSHEFGPEFEQHVLNLMMTDRSFVAKFRPIIDFKAFMVTNNRYLVEKILEHFDKFKICPSIEILSDVIRRDTFRDKSGVLARIGEAVEVKDISYVVERMMSWAKWSAIDAVLKNQNGESPSEFAGRIEKASRTGDVLTLNHTKLDEHDDIDDVRNPIISTPWQWLNEQLDGGPETGDLCVVLAPISGGKTTALVNIAAHSLSVGKFAVYFTFEDGEKKIKCRLRQNITGMGRSELASNKETAARKMRRFLTKYGGRCEIKRLQSRRSSVSEAASFVRNIEEACERKVDVVVTDYADRFKSSQKYTEPRHALREIMEDCKWLAGELNVVHWTARQVNKMTKGKEIISTDSAGESWGSMESPDLVIGFGRTMEDESLGRITLHSAKVRDNKDHQTRSLMVDFEKQKIFDPAYEE